MKFAKKQVTELVTKYKEMEYNFKKWLDKQPLAVEAAIAAIISGTPLAASSFVLDTIFYNPAYNSWLPFRVPPVLFKTKQTMLIDACKFGVLVGFDNGIRCVMKKTRGKDDIQTSMVSGFSVGVLLGMLHRKRPAVVMLYGIVIALRRGGFFKLSEKSKPS